MKNSKPISFDKVDITSGFWADKQKLNVNVINGAVHDRFEDTGRFEAFNFNWVEGCEFNKPHFYWDSDVAKWLEGSCNIYLKNHDEKLLKQVDDVIDKIEEHQQEDGYFNIFHTIIQPELKFKDRDHHELYCLGHLIEAAVAYKIATGSDRFIDILDKYVDLVIKAFVTEKTAAFVTPGHEEIELALVKLYRLTDNKKYLDLAKFFIDNRGLKIEYEYSWANHELTQSHLPVREQKTAEGHAVRACYLYSGMVDVASETADEELFDTTETLFNDIVNHKMYISGGIGSSYRGEAFTVPYDLPNDVAYTETCAAISMAFFADRMKEQKLDSKYADVFEREIYNGILSGLSLNGKGFFYENPLEINVADHYKDKTVKEGIRLPIMQRKEVFDCSCCPPNLTRFISSIGGSIYSYNDEAVIVHQFMSSKASFENMEITTETEYPANGKIHISVSNADGKKLYIRKPWWCESFTVSEEYSMNSGYICVEISGDSFDVDVNFEMNVQYYISSSKVRADSGKAAMMYGPVLYCMEKNDNPYELFNLEVDTESKPVVEFDSYYNCNTVTVDGDVCENVVLDGLYCLKKPIERHSTKIKFIPYNSFANRGESDMRVWFKYK